MSVPQLMSILTIVTWTELYNFLIPFSLLANIAMEFSRERRKRSKGTTIIVVCNHVDPLDIISHHRLVSVLKMSQSANEVFLVHDPRARTIL